MVDDIVQSRRLPTKVPAGSTGCGSTMPKEGQQSQFRATAQQAQQATLDQQEAKNRAHIKTRPIGSLGTVRNKAEMYGSPNNAH